MNFKDMTKKKTAELQKMLAEERGKLFDLKLKVAVNQLKDHAKIRNTRKKIAQLLTAMAQQKAESSNTDTK